MTAMISAGTEATAASKQFDHDLLETQAIVRSEKRKETSDAA
jgi:hypothetical protein